MRAAIRAFFANHPLLALLLVLVRWGLWFCAGHPVGVGTTAWALAAGVPPIAAVAAGSLIDFGANRLAIFTDGWLGRRFRILTLAARFQRRWPAAIAEAGQQRPHDRPVILSGRYFAAPDGLRPVLAAPRVRIKPLSITRTTVTWEVRPWSAQNYGEFSADADLVALADDRVLVARVAGRPPNRRRRWDLTIQFFESVQDPDGRGDRVVDDGFITPGSNGNSNSSGNGRRSLSPPQPLPDDDGDGGNRHNRPRRVPHNTERPHPTDRQPNNTNRCLDQGQRSSG